VPRNILLAILYIAFPLAVVAGTYVSMNRLFVQPVDPAMTTPILFDAAQAKSFRDIASELQTAGIIRSGLAFRLRARLQGKDTQIKAGEYELSPSMAPRDILDKLVRGDMFHRRVTIREGMNLADIADTIDKSGIVSKLAFEQALGNVELLQAEGLTTRSFEGYLFPDTYEFPRGTPADQIVRAMHAQLEKQWQPEWTQRVQIMEMSKHDILTLASIIEKESGNFDEQPVISSVFHNRLKKGMRLQADPTVIYGIKDFNGNITKKDLMTLTPYNTYMIEGLPPGPIANPGISAIKAALYPTDTNFLYFVGNGQGRHIFSETLEKHNEAVNKYQRNGGGDSETAPIVTTEVSADPIAAQVQ
jgi:UPF0755 protein